MEKVLFEKIKEMLEVSFEVISYLSDVKNIYGFINFEETRGAEFVYHIDNKVLQRHELQEHGVKNDIDFFLETEDFYLKKMDEIISLFDTPPQELPTRIFIDFNRSDEKIKYELKYDKLLNNMTTYVSDISDNWLKNLKLTEQ